MKYLPIFFLLALSACAQVQVNDIKVSQAASITPFPSYADRFTTPTVNSLWGFDSNKRPVNILLGTNLSLAGTTLNATGGSGQGTVSSFSAGNLSPLFTTSVATATTTPALSFLLSNASANVVFAGPVSGVASSPAFRALVSSDIPNLSGTYITAVTADPPLAGAGTGASHLSIPQASSSVSGYLLNTDWSAFNSKQSSGNYITALTGDVIATGPGSAAATLANTGVSAASYRNTDITVDSKGRIMSAENGQSGAIIIKISSMTVNTAGSPSDIGNITLPAWVNRYANIKPLGVIQIANGYIIAETASGTLASAQFEVRTSSGGGGSTLGAFTSGPSATNNAITAVVGGSLTPVETSTTWYVRQTADSANAGTVSLYVLIVPLI